MSNDKPAPTDAQILAACEEAGLWPNTAASWVANGAFARYHAAINRMLAAEAEKQAGPVAEVRQDGPNACSIYFLPAGITLKPGDQLYLHPSSDKEDAGMPCPYCADGHMVERRAMVCEGCKGTLVTKRQAGINIAARANR